MHTESIDTTPETHHVGGQRPQPCRGSRGGERRNDDDEKNDDKRHHRRRRRRAPPSLPSKTFAPPHRRLRRLSRRRHRARGNGVDGSFSSRARKAKMRDSLLARERDESTAQGEKKKKMCSLHFSFFFQCFFSFFFFHSSPSSDLLSHFFSSLRSRLWPRCLRQQQEQ